MQTNRNYNTDVFFIQAGFLHSKLLFIILKMAAVQYPSNPAPHVVVQGQPGAPPVQIVAQQPATVMVQNPNTSEAYNAKSARVTGWMQLSCAIACIVIGVIEIIVGSQVSIVGTGIWSGLLIILPTGILGIISQKKNTCVIIAYMVMSIISAIAGFVVFAMGITSAAVSSDESCSFIGGSCSYEMQRVRIAFDALLTITGVVELIVAIVAACYCCAGVCCGRTTSSANTMVYHYQNNVTPMVMMVPAYGQPVTGGQQQLAPAHQPQGHYPAPVGYPQGGNTQGHPPNYNMGAQAPPLYSEVGPLNQQGIPEKM